MGLFSSIKSFFQSKFNVFLILFLLCLGIFAFFYVGNESIAVDSDKFTVHFFYLPTCPHCSEQKPIVEELMKEMNDVTFIYHDASSQEGSALFYQMSKQAGLDTSKLAVPTLFVGEHPLVGLHTKEQITEAIRECQNNCKDGVTQKEVSSQEINTSFKDYELPILGRTDLTAYSLPVLAIVLGLVDGFNPCAMWVLVYLIGVLIGLNDKKKIWIIVGSFVLASGILYFLFMTAWINIFLLVGYIKVLTLIIGLVALGGGILSLKEYIETRNEALTCKVTDSSGRKKTMNKIQDIISRPLSVFVIFSIIGLAFIVNSVEFVCSAAIPAVFTQVLAMKELSAVQNYSYILLYVLFFMIDDIIIFGMAALAIGSKFSEKYAKYCRLIGGIILSVLGLIMVFAPNLLR
jgi:thiol-disulfide isomerase/thioredoxin